MSIQPIPKEIDANICDYCDKEIVDEPSSLQWAQVVRGFISNPTKTATAFRFWRQKPTYGEIIYDFHAVCFEAMVKDMLDRKDTLADQRLRKEAILKEEV